MTKDFFSLRELPNQKAITSLLELIGEAFVITDSEGRVVFANQVILDYLRLTSDQVAYVEIGSLLDSLTTIAKGAWGKIENLIEKDGFCREFTVSVNLIDKPYIFSVSAFRMDEGEGEATAQTISIWRKVNEGIQSRISYQKENGRNDQDHKKLEELVRQRTMELRMQNIALEKEIIERKQAEGAEREQRAIAEALESIAAILNRTPDMDKVLDNILFNLEDVVPYDSANVMLIDEEGSAQVVRYKGSRLFPSNENPPASFFSVEDTPTLKKMRETFNPIVIPSVEQDPNWISDIGSAWIQSYVAAPIFFGDRLLGYLNLVSAWRNFYNNIHAERLLAFASHASIAIRNAHLFKRVREFAALEERQRLAREMHDAVSQTLFTASLVAETLPVHWERDPAKGMEGLEKIQRLTKGALAEMRTILLELRPDALAKADLGDLIEQLGQGAKSYMEITLSSNINGKYPLPEKVHIAIYRMAQEIFNNIVKHARATHVHVDFQNLDGYVFLSITDNGRGFNTTELRQDRLGLKIMRERADSIGASLEILSQSAKGTNITIIWQENGKEESDAHEWRADPYSASR